MICILSSLSETRFVEDYNSLGAKSPTSHQCNVPLKKGRKDSDPLKKSSINLLKYLSKKTHDLDAPDEICSNNLFNKTFNDNSIAGVPTGHLPQWMEGLYPIHFYTCDKLDIEYVENDVPSFCVKNGYSGIESEVSHPVRAYPRFQYEMGEFKG